MAESSRNLGDFIRSRRLELGLSVSRAARTADVDRGTWTDWEKGNRTPFEANYVKIERALQLPPRYLSSRATDSTGPRDNSPPDDLAVMLEELGIDPGKWRRVPQSTKDAITTAYRVDRERRMKETQRSRGA